MGVEKGGCGGGDCRPLLCCGSAIGGKGWRIDKI